MINTLPVGLQRMFDLFGYSIDSTLSKVQAAIRMFGQGLTCTAHAQYIHNCSSALAMPISMSISMSTKRRTSTVWEIFELAEMVDDAGRKQYASCVSEYMQEEQPICSTTSKPSTHTKAVTRECSTQKQTTLGTFATTCSPILLRS